MKEVDTLIREKKCKNCMLCIEDLKDKPTETIIRELNDRLVTRTTKVANLED